MGIIAILKGEQPGFFATLLNYKNAGQFGEYVTEYALENSNLKGRYTVLKNLYIPYKNKTTEVDLIMIHEKGIFVFESKNYSGWIFGKKEDINWIQQLPNGNKHIFYNPIRQNNTHILAIAEYLGVKTEDFTSYIIFSERCTLKKVPESTDDVIILRRHKMLKHLRKLLKNREIIYTKDEIQQLERKLKPLTKVSNYVKKQHVKQIRKKYDSMECPFCGKKLEKKKGKYGYFIGCTGYPKCKYTRKIDK